MNLEHLFVTIRDNWDKIPNKKRALKYLRYHIELLAWKRSKLKLGAIVFEIKELKFAEFPIREDIEIRFIRQDTSIEDEKKLENVMKRLGWHWDIKNYIALGVVIFCGLVYLYSELRILYCKHLPTLAFREPHYDYALKYGFDAGFITHLGAFKEFSNLNYWIVDLLTDFCIHFNIIF